MLEIFVSHYFVLFLAKKNDIAYYHLLKLTNGTNRVVFFLIERTLVGLLVPQWSYSEAFFSCRSFYENVKNRATLMRSHDRFACTQFFPWKENNGFDMYIRSYKV